MPAKAAPALLFLALAVTASAQAPAGDANARRHAETVAKLDQTQEELKGVTAIGDDIRELLMRSDAASTRRLQRIADQDAAAELARRLQVIGVAMQVFELFLMVACFRLLLRVGRLR
jgi:hypothetical protein